VKGPKTFLPVNMKLHFSIHVVCTSELHATKGSFMDKSDLGVTDAGKSLCQILLERKDRTVSLNSLFRDDLFDSTCRKTVKLCYSGYLVGSSVVSPAC
jgi:hypothetical protein